MIIAKRKIEFPFVVCSIVMRICGVPLCLITNIGVNLLFFFRYLVLICYGFKWGFHWYNTGFSLSCAHAHDHVYLGVCVVYSMVSLSLLTDAFVSHFNGHGSSFVTRHIRMCVCACALASLNTIL